jgi:hypothetical protein
VDGEDEAHRRVEEAEVAPVLRVHPVLVALGDAQQAVQAPAVLAPAAQVGLDPLAGVVVVLLAVARGHLRVGIARVVGRAHLVHQRVAAGALQHVHLPGLGIGARGARAATRRMSATVARGTGVGAKARTQKRFSIAASTLAGSAMGACSWDMVTGKVQGLQAQPAAWPAPARHGPPFCQRPPAAPGRVRPSHLKAPRRRKMP